MKTSAFLHVDQEGEQLRWYVRRQEMNHMTFSGKCRHLCALRSELDPSAEACHVVTLAYTADPPHYTARATGCLCAAR